MAMESKRTTRRYWRRSAKPKSWLPWGIAPLVGLGVLFLFGALFMAPRIEADVRNQVAQRIDGSGLSVLNIRGDGQGVTIRSQAEAEKELYLEALAGSTKCDTWAGALACPTTVTIHRFESPDAPAVLETRPQPYVAEKTDEVAPMVAELPVQGELSAGSSIGRDHCNADFDAILGNASIRFRTGSASIDTGNDELLTRLAELAQRCPGRLTIQGHTDSQGNADNNQALSLARATAVRDALADRGIEIDRITAVGFGESQPIADNDTSSGRERNRRIAIIIDETN